MAQLLLTNKFSVGFAITVETPLRPFAMNYLAATGMFDKIVLVDPGGGYEVRLEGADLLKAADMVGLLTRVKDPNHHCTVVNCTHENHW